MYPWVIILTSRELEEYYGGNIYSYTSIIANIDKEIYKFIEEIIGLYDDKIKFYIGENTLDWSRFCEAVNAQPYDDSIFFSVKYFDYKTKLWNDYNIGQMELEQKFIKIIKKIYGQKIKLSTNVVKCIDKANSSKIKSYFNNNVSKSELTIEL